MPGHRRVPQADDSFCRADGVSKDRPHYQSGRAGLFNFALQDFFTQVESGRWLMRDKRTETAAVLLIRRGSRVSCLFGPYAHASAINVPRQNSSGISLSAARGSDRVGQFSAERVHPFARHRGADLDEARAEARACGRSPGGS